jgi:hypothetical protein
LWKTYTAYARLGLRDFEVKLAKVWPPRLNMMCVARDRNARGRGWQRAPTDWLGLSKREAIEKAPELEGEIAIID